MEFITGVLDRIAQTPLSQFIHESPVVFPNIECIHVIAICMVFGTIMIIDLRLIGKASMNRTVTGLMGEILPLTWVAFALAVLTGALLFISQPVDYAANTAFRLKMVALAFAGLNMLAFHAGAYRHVATWDALTLPPTRARLAGAVSLTLWIAIIACGRTIGFTMFPG